MHSFIESVFFLSCCCVIDDNSNQIQWTKPRSDLSPLLHLFQNRPFHVYISATSQCHRFGLNVGAFPASVVLATAVVAVKTGDRVRNGR